jgi:hypothetical protein
MKTKHILKIFFILFLFLIALFVYRLSKLDPIENFNPEEAAKNLQTIYEAVELKSQDDFKMIGQTIYAGTGFEPGFNMLMSIAGTKFGTDIVSQYGETRYVGYLDLMSQSTSSKVFFGKMLNKENALVDSEVEIVTKICTMPSGDKVPFILKISVGDEKLQGCANVVN